MIADAARAIDASGKYVIPGGIDVHTHMDMPLGKITSSDDFATGTRAAAFGGTTCIIDYATQARGTRIGDAYSLWRRKGEKATLDYGLHLILTELQESNLSEMNAMVDEGVSSFKLFMAYPDALMVDDRTIYRALRQSARNRSLICVHAENGAVIAQMVQDAAAQGKTAPIHHALTRPVAAEREAVSRAIALAEIAGAAIYIVHVSTSDALERIAEARNRGLPVYAETCPHYLLLSEDELRRPGFEGAKYVLTPPLRERRHQAALWDGLNRGILQAVSTDHCPFNYKGQKDLGRENFARIPNGGPGVENRLQLIYHFGVNAGRIGLQQWVEMCATAPARIFGLHPQKGTLIEGSDADIVIWDPNRDCTISARTHHMRVDYSLYEGFQTRGCAETVFSRGSIVVDRGVWRGREGWGRYVKRAPFVSAAIA